MMFCMIHVKKRYFDVLQISCKRETPSNIIIFFYIQMFYERGLIGLFFVLFNDGAVVPDTAQQLQFAFYGKGAEKGIEQSGTKAYTKL